MVVISKVEAEETELKYLLLIAVLLHSDSTKLLNLIAVASVYYYYYCLLNRYYYPCGLPIRMRTTPSSLFLWWW